MLSLAPQATLVDIAHGVPARDVAAGAVALAQAAPLFPPGTIHVVVVDPGVGGARADLVVASGGSLYLGPDNGVLSLAARGPRQIFRIEAPGFRREPVSPTFHGRDVFAPAAGRLAAGAAASDAGPPQEIDGGAERAAAAPARRRHRGGGDPRRRLRQPHHLAAGRGGRARGGRRDGRGRRGRRALRASARADVLRRRDRARSSPTSAAADSWRSPAATARPPAAWAPSGGRSSACGARRHETRGLVRGRAARWRRSAAAPSAPARLGDGITLRHRL